MKVPVSIFLGLLCSAFLLPNAVAADKCKNKFDESGASETKKVDAGVGPTQNLNLGFSTDGENYFLVTACMAIIKAPPMEIGSDTPMAVSLEDGSDIVISPVTDTRAKRTFFLGAWNRKKMHTVYGVSREDVERMAESSIDSVEMSYRVNDEMGKERIDINPENRNTIRHLARCILASDGR